MRIFKTATTPTTADGLAVGDIWIDITSGAVEKLCTSISPVTFTSTTSSDSNGNATADNFLAGYATTATAAGTTTLTVDSVQQQFFTGSTTQTVTLPVTSTLALGFSFRIVNNSTGAVTVNSSGGNAVVVMAAATVAIVTCILTSGTGAASWDYTIVTNASGITGTGSLVRATSPSFTTPVLGTITSGNLSAGTGSLINLTTVTTTADISIATMTIGRGTASVATNTIMGYRSGEVITTAASTVGIGYLSLFSLTSGLRNIGIGEGTLQNLQTGADNCALGYNAGISATSSRHAFFGSQTGTATAAGATAVTGGTDSTFLGYASGSNSASSVGTISLGANAVSDIHTGTGSGDIGPGIAIGSAANKVGFAGDGSIIQTAGSSVGYWRVKINGTYYKFLMMADS